MRKTQAKPLLKACFALTAILYSHRLPAAVVWPQFRGPNCAGVSESGRPPTDFGLTTNLLWKTELPAGLSSPCVWRDRIFLTAFDQRRLETICIRRRDGKILWRQTAPAEQIEEINPASSPASATPATDGKRVYVYFGSCGVLAYAFDGRECWRKPLPVPSSLNGSGTSPALMEDLIIINRDQEEGKSSLLAMDARTGRTVWETPHPEFFSSYSTPVLWKRDRVKEVVVAGSVRLVGYGLSDGKERWSANGLEVVSVCPTPVIGEGQLYAMSRSFGGSKPPSFSQTLAEADKNGDHKLARDEARGPFGNKHVFNLIDKDKDGFVTEEEWNVTIAFLANAEYGIFALRQPGGGDITGTHVAWKQKRGVPTVSSPLYYRGRVYVVQDGGRVTSYHAKTGQVLLEQERLGADGEYFASPVAADGKIYFASTRGTISVIEAADTLKVLARNQLSERIMATPAIADSKLYVRTAAHLWAFGRK
jgi:outer membrane protein assembly factor BamB